MKTKEVKIRKPLPDRDTRFDVGRTTEVLNNIKKNDKAMARLDQLQEIIEEMQDIWGYAKLGERLIYKDAEGNEIDQGEFWDELYRFVTTNQDHLMRETAREYQYYVILTRDSKLKRTA